MQVFAMQPQPPTAGSDSAGTAEVDRLLLELQRNLEDAKLSLKQQEERLSQVKVYGRNPSTAGPIFSAKGVETLSKYGLDKPSSPSSYEALRCLANAFLLNEPSRQVFVRLGYPSKAAERLKEDDRDNEFLLSRIVFLLTYTTDVDLDELVDKHALADSVNQHVARHAKKFATKSARRKSAESPMEDMAMAETLKLMFNVTYYRPELVSRFTPAVEPLISLMLHHPLPTPPLEPPIKYILNALLNMDLRASEKNTPMGREARSSPIFPCSDPEGVVDRLVGLFDNAIRSYPERELDQAAAPLCTLIRRCYELAQPQMKVFMRRIMLPRDKDRDRPLGTGDTISARLLRLSCSPNVPTLRENVSSLLFELSDKDANKFVKNIGYGFASGFLMSHNIEIPSNAAEASSIASDDTSEGTADFNPVTGQRLSSEKSSETPMTEEEKQREAERLFVLFERLKATGVMDVTNPVQQAVEEGRFEELPD